MTPETAIAMLDRQLAAHGEEIRLQRLTLGPGGVQIPFEVVCNAFVRGYAPDELVGGITQQDAKVIISPTEIIANDWPGPATSPTTSDRRVPRKGDRTYIAGKARAVEAAAGLYLAGELVRIEMRVLG